MKKKPKAETVLVQLAVAHSVSEESFLPLAPISDTIRYVDILLPASTRPELRTRTCASAHTRLGGNGVGLLWQIRFTRLKTQSSDGARPMGEEEASPKKICDLTRGDLRNWSSKLSQTPCGSWNRLTYWISAVWIVQRHAADKREISMIKMKKIQKRLGNQIIGSFCFFFSLRIGKICNKSSTALTACCNGMALITCCKRREAIWEARSRVKLKKKKTLQRGIQSKSSTHECK